MNKRTLRELIRGKHTIRQWDATQLRLEKPRQGEGNYHCVVTDGKFRAPFVFQEAAKSYAICLMGRLPGRGSDKRDQRHRALWQRMFDDFERRAS